MGKAIVNNDKSMVPGFGIAGQVMCPLSFMAPKMCNKQGCEWWVELKYADKNVARCAISWLAVLSTEVRASIDRLKSKTPPDYPKKKGG